ncbi:hypothetical protein HK098_002803 [Nowakowskiella sp. JEL0407]|nr:hypothetical protein HK098_002803 [Nowakowskiella sp. JEL0407]
MSSSAIQPVSFSECWLSALSGDRGAWTLLSASLLIVYGRLYLFIRSKILNFPVFHKKNAISGTCGIIIQTAFAAVNVAPDHIIPSTAGCNNLLTPSGQSAIGVMLGVNELFWFLNETSIVLYSFFKVETVTSVTMGKVPKLVLRCIMAVFVVGYLPLRIYIGYLRTSHHTTWDVDIGYAHGFAFTSWAFVELVIMGMLFQAAFYAKKETQSASQIIGTIFSSSILRLMIISLNQIAIAIVTRIPTNPSLGVFENCLWLIRGVYPMILMFDILSTRSLLFERAGSTGNNSFPHTSGNGSTNFSSYKTYVIQDSNRPSPAIPLSYYPGYEPDVTKPVSNSFAAINKPMNVYKRGSISFKSVNPIFPQTIPLTNREVVPKQLWGFDPLELLEKIDFPNDAKETLLRRSKSARLLAIRRLPLPDEEKTQSTKFVDTPIVSTADEADSLQEQLARSAAAIMIQCVWKGLIIRRKYLAVVHAKLSLMTISSENNFDWDAIPDLSGLNVQSREERSKRENDVVTEILRRADRMQMSSSTWDTAAKKIQKLWKSYYVGR